MTTDTPTPDITHAFTGSSTIHSLEWFASTPGATDVPSLRVQFHSGGTYNFLGVAEGTARDMIAAESAGKFFAAYIKGKFDSAKESPAVAKPKIVAMVDVIADGVSVLTSDAVTIPFSGADGTVSRATITLSGVDKASAALTAMIDRAVAGKLPRRMRITIEEV